MSKKDDASSPAQDGKDDEKKANSAAFHDYFRIFSYAASNNGLALASLALVCAIGSGIPLPLMNIIFGRLIGTFNEYFIPGSHVTEGQFKANVDRESLYIFCLFLGKFTLTYIAMFCARITGLRISAALRLHYLQSLFTQPVSRLDEISVGTVANTITGLSNTIQQSVSDKLAILFQSLALVVAAYAVAFRYSWVLTLITSSALVFVITAFCITVPILVAGQKKVDETDEQHATIAGEVFGSIRTVLSLGAEDALSEKYSYWIEQSRKVALSMSFVTGIHLALLFFAMYSSYALSFWTGLKFFRDGRISSVSVVIIVFFSLLILVSVLGAIASPLMIISKAASASSAFWNIIDAEPMSLTGLRSPEVSSRGDIEFRNVNFAYPTRKDSQVLKQFTARFHSGKTTALVGPSGSGKSTVVSLLERWYQLNEKAQRGKLESNTGVILVDGKNISELDVKWWRSQIGLVQQEPFLFNDTIFNNVAFGLIGSQWENDSQSVKETLVKEACKEAFADEFIQKLPEGYSTLVGENGIKLSGGQRQRLAIARSIIKQPAILVLDEATSSIDVHGEQIVQTALDRVSKNRTTIMIAHRLSTIRKADQIVVLRGGTNVEEGSHEELMAKPDGIYHGLVHAQRLEIVSASNAVVDQGVDIADVDSQFLKKGLRDRDDEDSKHLSAIRQGFFRDFGLLLYEQRGHWLLYVFILGAAAGAGSASALQSWLFAKLVQVFRFTGEKLVLAANFWSLMFFILALSMAFFYFSIGNACTRLSVNVASFYRAEYFHNTLWNPIPFYDHPENASGSLLSRLSIDPKQLQELLGFNGAFPLISIFNMTGSIMIAFLFGWKLALVAVFAALPVMFSAAYIRIRWELQFEQMNTEVYAESSKFATEAIGAFRTVTSLTMENYIINKYSTLLKQQREKAVRKAWYATLVFAFSDSIELCAMALTFWYGGQLLASHEYGAVSFLVVYIAIIQGGQAAGQFFSIGPNLAQATASANRIFGMRSIPSGRTCPLGSQESLTSLVPNLHARIEFDDVSFLYPSREVPTFLNLKFVIEKGQFIAFVGPSGCGKTTVVSLLERFYEPVRGRILFGDRDIRTMDVSSYRKLLSLVSQEPKLFKGTIRENLLLGLHQSFEVSEQDIVQVCRDAEIHDFIMSLPDGYNTDLGISAQTSLSGGQKQRLCIARALLRRPSVLLLDEATSSLDSQSEKLVQTAMERLAGKRSMTIIAVAHRLATIQKADVIFVFSESQVGRGSRIVEHGSHQELLRRRGTYWQMCQAQALDQ